MQKIVIIGCPRSGTTLLQHLIATCFEDVFTAAQFELRPSPWYWDRVCPTPRPGTVLFKQPEFPLTYPQEFYDFMVDGGLVLGITRDPRSLLTSQYDGKPYWGNQDRNITTPPEQRWRQMARVIRKLRKHGSATEIRYEDLLTKPEEAQAFLAERFGLTVLHPFTEGHKHMTPDVYNARAMNKPRPLDPTRAEVGCWEDVRALGYEPDEEMIHLAECFGYFEPVTEADLGVAPGSLTAPSP
jgi:hypothetical protein